MLLYIVLLLVPFEPEVVRLEGVDTLHKYTELRVNADGSILMHSGSKIFHWNKRGKLIHQFTLPRPEDGAIFVHASIYDVARGLYLINTQHYFHFYDRESGFLGRGYLPPDKNREKAYYRALYSVGDTFLAYPLILDFWKNPEAEFLVQLSFEQDEDGNFPIKQHGPFAVFSRDQQRMQQRFRRHWIVPGSTEDELYIAYELSSHLRHFRSFEEQKRIPLALRDFVPPPKAWNDESQTREGMMTWLNSMSRINGLFVLGEDFLIGYSQPVDPSRTHLQVLQPINASGRNLGPEKVLKGYLIGAHEQTAYIFDEKTKSVNMVLF